MKKIAVPVKKADKNTEISQEFGRTPYFAIIQGEKIEFAENPGATSGGGAGVKAAQFLITTNVKKLILRKSAGPHAMKVLKSANIDVEITNKKNLSDLT